MPQYMAMHYTPPKAVHSPWELPNSYAELSTFVALQGMALSDFHGNSSEEKLQRAQGTAFAQGTSLYSSGDGDPNK